MTDADGHCPVCGAIGAAVIEIGGTALDLNETRKTLQDPNASTTEKVVTTVATAAGLFLPGGGYGALSKSIIKRAAKQEAAELAAKTADDVADATRVITKTDDATDAARAAPKLGSQGGRARSREKLSEVCKRCRASGKQ